MDRDEDIHPEAAVAPGYLANHAARAFNRRVDQALRPLGVSLALVGPLLLLNWKGSMRQRDLVNHSAVRQPAMAALLTKLETSGLITRRPSPTDGRAAFVELTDQGRAVAEAAGDVLRGANVAGLEGFTAEEAGRLVGLLHRLIANLEGSEAQGAGN